jgi:uncharacterized protein (DUF488 family)
MDPPRIWTIGHSTRSIEQFLKLLGAHRIHQVVDVRLIPFSRRNPQFNTEAVRASLKAAGVSYLPMPDLGGRRKARLDSPNLGWRNASFRGYADHMQTDSFWSALDDLMRHAADVSTAVMCAEAVPWRCHRSLIADALVTRGWTVQHILSQTQTESHELTAFARIERGRLVYPGPATKDEPSGRLF